MTDERKGDVQAALEEIGRRAQIDFLIPARDAGDVGDAPSAPVAVLPHGYDLKSLKHVLDEYLPAPERMRGRAQFTEIQSLAEYVNRYKRPETIIYIDDRNKLQPVIEVVFDDHQPEAQHLRGPNYVFTETAEPDGTITSGGLQRLPQAAPESALPGWRDFRAEYPFPLTPEWKAWVDVSTKWLDQAQLATFLEDHVLEVVDPSDPGEAATRMATELGLKLASGSKLLELSRGLAINVDQKVIQTLNLTTGEGQVSFEETHKDAAGAKLTIPGAFAIAVPVFRGGDFYRIAVRLKYRTQGGRLAWSLVPHRLDQVFENAIEGAAKQLRDKTAVLVLRGCP